MNLCLSSAEQLLQIKDTDHLLYFNGSDLILIVINDKFTLYEDENQSQDFAGFFPKLC